MTILSGRRTSLEVTFNEAIAIFMPIWNFVKEMNRKFINDFSIVQVALLLLDEELWDNLER